MDATGTRDESRQEPGWDHSDCRGAEGCPPRCPRFVGREGTPLLVRPYRPSDFDSLAAFYDQYPNRYRSMGLPPVTRPRVESWLDGVSERGRNLVAFDDGSVAGHVAYTPQDEMVPEMVVYVGEDYQNRGLGTELCQQAIAYAAADGAVAITLNVDGDNDRAIHVYRQLGFYNTNQEGNLVEMRLDIDDDLAREVQAPPAERL